MAKLYDAQHNNHQEESEFYEVMPYAPAFPYSDTADNYDDEFYSDSGPDIASEAKMTAIVTLVLVGVVTLALGLLAIRGLEAVRDTTAPAVTGTTI